MKKCKKSLFFIGVSLALLVTGCSDEQSLNIASECIKGGITKSGSVLDEAQCVKRSEDTLLSLIHI